MDIVLEVWVPMDSLRPLTNLDCLAKRTIFVNEMGGDGLFWWGLMLFETMETVVEPLGSAVSPKIWM